MTAPTAKMQAGMITLQAITALLLIARAGTGAAVLGPVLLELLEGMFEGLCGTDMGMQLPEEVPEQPTRK